jgi:UDP:flavonoid glycosyltransferase YjiC (YdhE family)
MAENASRVDWAGVGVRLPRRYATPRGVRAAVGRVLRESRLRERAAEVARWVAVNDGGLRAAEELEAWAGALSAGPRRPAPR